jgi:phosphonopyruvate decarboxylase
LEALSREAVDFYTGVPDSLLKNFLAVLAENTPSSHHVICANEGNAIALAAGYHLASGKVPLVYMQNSGLGNAVNPLMSLAHSGVYGLPLVLMIGWRGQPEQKDEPQHKPMGGATIEMLNAMAVPCKILSAEIEEAREQLKWSVSHAQERSQPAALLCPAGVFSEEKFQRSRSQGLASAITREIAVAAVLKQLGPADAVVATTGFIGRQVLAVMQDDSSIGQRSTFLNVGAMGHASQIAMGMALARTDARVICLDGDGAAIMHLGGLTTIGVVQPANLKHVILNNGMHESVGGQPTAAGAIDFTEIAKACGYPSVFRCEDPEQLESTVKHFLAAESLALLEVRICQSNDKLPRPNDSMTAMKQEFVETFNKRLSAAEST